MRDTWPSDTEVRVNSRDATEIMRQRMIDAGHIPEPEQPKPAPEPSLPPIPRYIDWQPSLMELMLATSIKHRVTIDDMRSKSRARKYCRARQEYFWLARTRTTKSLKQIGTMAGWRDHATVLHGSKEHQKRLDEGTA